MDTLETFVKLLKDDPNHVQFQRRFDVFVAAMVDLANRLSTGELNDIKQNQRLAAAETAITDLNTTTSSLANDRTNLMRRQDAVEQTPAAHGGLLEDFEKRVRTIEGAIHHMTEPKSYSQDAAA